MKVVQDSELENGGYYAVIFTSHRKGEHDDLYESIAQLMSQKAPLQKGFIGVESARNPDGLGITVSYWKTQDDIAVWRADMEHQVAQKMGREKFYASFSIRVCKVERAYHFKS